MDWVAVAAVASSTGVVFVGLAQVRAWRRNGHDQKTRDENQAVKQALRDKETEMAYKAIGKELHHREHGLGAIEKKVTSIDKELARHDERITNLEN